VHPYLKLNFPFFQVEPKCRQYHFGGASTSVDEESVDLKFLEKNLLNITDA